MKRISMTEVEEQLFIKVEHQLEGLVASVSIFLFQDGQVQEIAPGVLSEETEQKIASRDYDRTATEEELEVVHEILEKRDQYMLGRTSKTIEEMGGITLLRLIELGGRYFAYTMHEHLIHTRIAEVLLTPHGVPVEFLEVPVDYLPSLAQNIAPILLQDKPKKGATLTFGEGLFLRIKRFDNRIFGTVIRLDGEGVEGKLRAPLAFSMRLRKGEWEFVSEEETDKNKMEKEMEKALSHVFNELALANKPITPLQ